MTVKKIKRSLSNAKHIGMVLRKLADLVEKSSTDDIDALLRGNGELQVCRAGSRLREVGSKRQHLPSEELYSVVAKKLHSSQTREVGRKLLASKFSTKISIEEFARFLDLPVHRTDTIDSLCEKIVESEIGSRLRSEAVQGRKV